MQLNLCRLRKFAALKQLIGRVKDGSNHRNISLIPQSKRNQNRMRVVLPYDSGFGHLGEKLRK